MSEKVFSTKEAFVARELTRHGEYMTELFVNDIKRRKIINSEELLNSLESVAYSVNNRNAELSFSFPDYGRFIEINWHKRKRSAYKTLTEQARREVWGLGATRKRRKRTTWYAHNFYGSLNTLIGRISWGYTEEVAEEIKMALEMKKNEI